MNHLLNSFNLPCLIIHGNKDRICNVQDSKYFIENIKQYKYFDSFSKVKQLHIINDGYHEMYIDFEKEEFFNKTLSWIIETKNYGKTDKRIQSL